MTPTYANRTPTYADLMSIYIYKRHNNNFLVFCLEPLTLFGVILILQWKIYIQGDIVIEVGSSRGYIGWSRDHVGIKSGQSVLGRSQSGRSAQSLDWVGISRG